ncbi:MAG: SAM-dependent chlorinase/fluorinase [Gammaproteobacteria bacterium]|nr:SAM-dependent chlorinase/fluorinase [Gammaproteobacteria bacterium]
MLTRFAAARIIDLTHEILVHWPAEAGFWLSRSWRYFPPGTVHVAVVDPGVGTRRDIIVVQVGGGPEGAHVFLAPDNGLLAPVIGQGAASRVWRLDAHKLERFALGTPSATFSRVGDIFRAAGGGAGFRALPARGPG